MNTPRHKAAREMSLEELQRRVGSTLAITEWLLIDQPLIDRFAEITGDRYFIHTDPARAAAEGPYGSTIAHGMLVLSLLSDLANRSLPICQGLVSAVNYGFDGVRFLAPVRSGSRIRAHFTLIDIQRRTPARVMMRYRVAVETDEQSRHALMLEWLCLVFLGSG